MKVSELPLQAGKVPDVSAIVTAGVTFAVTFTVIELEVAVVGLAQEATEVMTQVTF